MKSVQIPEDLFCDLFLYHVIGIDEPGARIKTALEQKMEALKRHDLYTKYKTSKNEAAYCVSQRPGLRSKTAGMRS